MIRSESEFLVNYNSVPMRKVREWLEGACKSPSEKMTKERLKRLLA